MFQDIGTPDRHLSAAPGKRQRDPPEEDTAPSSDARIVIGKGESPKPWTGVGGEPHPERAFGDGKPVPASPEDPSPGRFSSGRLAAPESSSFHDQRRFTEASPKALFWRYTSIGIL
ncbi:hypothetical protein G7Z17_g5628 [Cylindrodendrum hubeiense]|uniref:Uncharacterized protein n=1 Tax=Cylindrodendrum hubeiense TaxID=595255 RepID=A0A9P5HBQ8_9HYPO|nr:hypothetical protein G7Z17_g5628 [Cylindrodendrum hubeiense]